MMVGREGLLCVKLEWLGVLFSWEAREVQASDHEGSGIGQTAMVEGKMEVKFKNGLVSP